MKGMVFTEFLEMVEASFSAEMVDDILDDCELASQGAYTAVGTYDHRELVALVSALSRRVSMPESELVFAFGRHLFSRFVALYPRFFTTVAGAVDFLQHVETYIHTEVLKLYPDAELPAFEFARRGEAFVVIYRSVRDFSDLAHGLITGCLEHFDESYRVDMERVSGPPRTEVRFTLMPASAA